MAKLTKAESAMLEKLKAKAEAPDAPATARTLNVTIDLGDPDQVARAQKLGLLDGEGDEGDEGDESDEGDEGDEPPERRGYFK